MKFVLKAMLVCVVAWQFATVGQVNADEPNAADTSIAAAAAPASPPEFQATLLDGSTVIGKLTDLTDDTANLQTAKGEQKIALAHLLSLVQTGKVADDLSLGKIHVVLADGTSLFAEQLTADKQSATLSLGAGKSLEMPLRSVRLVRWREAVASNAQTDTAWREFTRADQSGDLLVVRENGAFDSIEGAVGGITAETIQFSLDGNPTNVKLSRVEGIVFARNEEQQTDAPRAVAHLTDGSRWSLAAWKTSADGALELTTIGGIIWKTSFSEITKLDFSAGKLVYLSDLEPEKIDYRPFFAPAAELPALRAAYLPRGDRAVDGLPLVLDGRTYPKGLAMYSKGLLVYRLPEKLNQFSALVGIADRARLAGGNVELSIKGDGKTLWQGSIRAGDAPVPLQFAITGVKRLEFMTDYGSGQDVGDHLLLCDAKVTQ